MAIPQIIAIDGDILFQTAQEVDGSPTISTDPVTRSKTVTRKYAILKSFYTPLIYGNFVPIPDRQYPTCILIEEVPDQTIGPIFYFSRVYCEIPAARNEPIAYAFAMPGKSSVTLSATTGKPVNWRQYGNGSPYTRVILSNIAYTYKAGDPGVNGAALFTIPTLTRISYVDPLSGPISVDYVGDVYNLAGSRGIFAQQGGITVIVGAEPLFVYAGSTSPRVIPATWIQEVNIRRWRGAIWEMSVITVPTS